MNDVSCYVIVVTYNGKKWYDRCLNSLFNSSIFINVMITSRIFRTFFWGSPGQVLLCLKSGHHGRLSRTHGPDVYFCFW